MNARFFLLIFLFFAGFTSNLHTRHDVHASYAKMAVDGHDGYMSIRLFTDDLEQALRKFHKKPNLKVRLDEASMQDFQQYLNWKLVLKLPNGKQVSGKVLNVQQEDIMTVFVVEYHAASRTLDRFKLRHDVLKEIFDDQRNVIKFLKLPGDVEQSQFFGGDVHELEIVL